MPRGWQRSVLFDWCERELTPLSTDYRDFILDQLSQVEDIMPRRMFGGLGLFNDSVMFGILSSMDGFYLRVDNINQPDFEALSAEPFRPNQGGGMTMACFQTNTRLLAETYAIRLPCTPAPSAAESYFRCHSPDRNQHHHLSNYRSLHEQHLMEQDRPPKPPHSCHIIR